MKKHYIFSIICFFAMPVFMAAGVMLAFFINPEIAAHTQNYERNYRLLEMARNLCLLATILGTLGMWLLTCLLLLKSKGQSYRWLPLSLLGPLGFTVLAALRDNAPSEHDSYQRFVGKQRFYLRAAYESGLFIAVWVLAYCAIALKQHLMILVESMRTGITPAQIMETRNASSGMWAFGEGLEMIYMVVAIYLLWPPAFNLGCRLLKSLAAS